MFGTEMEFSRNKDYEFQDPLLLPLAQRIRHLEILGHGSPQEVSIA